MPEWSEQFTIPIIRYTMEDDDRQEENQQLHTKKVSLHTTVKIETPETGRRCSGPSHYIPPQCNNRLSPRAARKRNERRSSRTDMNLKPPPRKTCNCVDCRPSNTLLPGLGQTLNPGYEQYRKSLLEVPWCNEYTEASSDDLSSEWDSDVPEPPPRTSKVSTYVITQVYIKMTISQTTPQRPPCVKRPAINKFNETPLRRIDELF
ncbi:hypothetical protein EVAR_64244_1 [Eumeta japonica]|uniref:Uncharacterized protein n=1 Tax=Eumeta variegata TaxID=151549 RepID=A0A4C1ZBM1_EUMVA|nr:hypothetical protein EVAR_64244_1 [Eumeta japonica]